MLAATAARSVLAVGLVIVLLGCYQSYQSFTDVDSDGHVDADGFHEVDADVDVRVDADAASDEGGDVDVVRDAADADGDADADAYDAGDADGDVTACDGAWLDPTTGYLWENPPSDTMRNWDDAMSYCNGLSLCGYPAGSWHLPTISELRSFIRGCPGTVTGGACGVTDSCLDSSCWSSAACNRCSWLGGPDSDGCYWDSTVGGDCYWYWSSSSYAESTFLAWVVNFTGGSVNGLGKTVPLDVRCVRREP